MRCSLCLVVVGLLAFKPGAAQAQTADEVTKLIHRLIDLDSIDLAKEVKYCAGLEPSLHMFDADESAMKVLANPYEVHGKNKPGAAGWYRVRFTAPETIGKFALPKGGYNLGVESNCLGSWEIYTYNNGKPAGAAMATGVKGAWNQGNLLLNARQHPTAWMSNAPMPTKPGDKIIIAILATATPLGRGSPEGYALRHLRLRFALAHTGARQPFYGNVTAPGMGTGLHGAREMLATRKGEELKALQEKLQGPLSRLDALFKAAETGRLDELTKAMRVATNEINGALKK
jgi:hypothetical protein